MSPTTANSEDPDQTPFKRCVRCTGSTLFALSVPIFHAGDLKKGLHYTNGNKTYLPRNNIYSINPYPATVMIIAISLDPDQKLN